MRSLLLPVDAVDMAVIQKHAANRTVSTDFAHSPKFKALWRRRLVNLIQTAASEFVMVPLVRVLRPDKRQPQRRRASTSDAPDWAQSPALRDDWGQNRADQPRQT